MTQTAVTRRLVITLVRDGAFDPFFLAETFWLLPNGAWKSLGRTSTVNFPLALVARVTDGRNDFRVHVRTSYIPVGAR